MEPFTRHTGLAVSLDRVNVDTDQIIPKQFLKRIERTGYGQYLFFDWRFLESGQPDPDFVLNNSRYKGASVLILDEATSALDTKTEELVMRQISDLHPELTVIIIAHRISTLEKCDEIFEFTAGGGCKTIRYQDLVGDGKKTSE